MNDKTKQILTQDSISESEKMFGNKHWSQFDQTEQFLTMLKCLGDNAAKAEHMKSIGDTYFGIHWFDFISLIQAHGFQEGLKYDFAYEGGIEEAIIYYHKEQGLILWANSISHQGCINNGKVYGMVKYDDWELAHKSLYGSNGDNGERQNIRWFDFDIREGLVSKLKDMEDNLVFLKKWQGPSRPFLYFIDYTGEDHDNYKQITQEKISRCPQELQDIVNGLEVING